MQPGGFPHWGKYQAEVPGRSQQRVLRHPELPGLADSSARGFRQQDDPQPGDGLVGLNDV